MVSFFFFIVVVVICFLFFLLIRETSEVGDSEVALDGIRS